MIYVKTWAMVLKNDNKGGAPEPDNAADTAPEETQDLPVGEILVIRRAGESFHVFMSDVGMMVMGMNPNEFGGVVANMEERFFQKVAKSPAFIRVPTVEDGAVHESYARAPEIVLIWDDEDGTHFCIADTKREFVTPMKAEVLMQKSLANYMAVSFPDGKIGYLNVDFSEDFNLKPEQPLGSPDVIIN